MAGAILPVYRWQVTDSDFVPAAGAKMYTYLSGTSTPSFVYSDAALSTERTNPVVADADGVFPICFLGDRAYRIEITESDGTVIFPAQDNIQDWGQVFGGDVTGPASSTDNAIARWNGTDGSAIQSSGITISDAASGTLAGSNSGDVTLAGTPDYITIANQVITRGLIDLTTDVTGILPGANGGAASVEQTTTATGGQNNFAPSTGSVVLLRCTGAAPSFTGFTGGTTGRELWILCLGTTAQVVNESASSDAANRIVCPSTNGLVVGVNGLLRLVYDNTTSRWRAQTISAGSPITPTFSAGDYTASSGDWTVASGDVTTMAYSQVNKQLTVWVALDNTTVSATPASLRRAIPGGFTATKTEYAVGAGVDNGATREAILLVAPAGDTAIRFELLDGSNFAAAADATDLYGTITFEVT